jgi:hypothetical protein
VKQRAITLGDEEWSQDDNVNANGNGKTEPFFSRFTQKLNKGFLPKNLDFYSHTSYRIDIFVTRYSLVV